MELVRAGFASLTARPPRDLIAVAGAWTAILIVGQILVLLAAGGPTNTDGAPGRSLASALVELTFSIVNIVAFVDIAVKWIRCLVLDESPHGFLEHRLNARRWSFLLRSLLLALTMLVTLTAFTVAVIGVAASLGVGGAEGGLGILVIPVTLGALFLFSYVFGGRLGLYLVGAALGDPRMSLTASWNATRGNGVAITLAVLAVMLAFFIPGIAALALAAPPAGMPGTAASLILAPPLVVLNVAAYLVYEAVVARAYTRLVPEPRPGTLVV